MNSSLIPKKRGERENIEDTDIIAIQDQILVIMILQAMMMKLSRGEADQSITNDDGNQNPVLQILQAMKTMVLSGGEVIQSTTNATIAGLSHMIQVPQAMNTGLVMQSIISVVKDHTAWIQGRRILMGLGMTEGADL
jgi:aromatic ring hydroxylase